MSETTYHGMKMTYVIVPEAEYLNREASEMVYAGQHENALALFDRALTLDPFSADTWYNQGNCLDDLGRQGDAIECYDHAIRFDPCHAESWFAKGVNLKKMGKFPEAERCIDQAVRLAQGLAE
jgi:tetratricopeptide (TPR) repeat protein